METKSVNIVTFIFVRETNLSQVLQSDKIYKNAIKGDQASKEELESAFKDMANEEIIKLILNKGEVQISEKERMLNFSNVKNDIANLIVEKTYNYNTGLPFPQTLILQVLNDIHFDAREEHSSKKQAIQAIKIIQECGIIPIERKYMQLEIKVKKGKVAEDQFESHKERINKFLEESKAKIISQSLDKIETFKITFNILPNYYRDIVTTFEECKILLIFYNIINSFSD